MADKVVVNYEALSNAQAKFSQLATTVLEMRRKLDEKTETLHQDGWQGKGSDSFYNEMSEQVSPAIGRLGEALTEASTKLNEIARIYNEADESTCTGFGDRD